MAHYQVTLAYDGTDLKGFQRQRNARTVQGEFEKALKKLGWNERSILSSGRTDTGVHALGQVISFHLDWQHSEEELRNALNDSLSAAISAVSVKVADEEFHPRFDALMRSYRYQIYFSAVADPLKERYFWRVWPKPDQDILKQSSCFFLGKHDFRGYGKPPDEKSTTVRTIHAAEWEFTGDGSQAFFTISAQAFLYHMVRRIVYVLVRAGQARISLQELKDSIENQSELLAGIAPASGLILEQITYK